MIKAAYSDKELVVDILTKSFDTNKSVNYVVRQGKNREKRIKALMNYSFETCWNNGEIYLSDDRKGALLFLLPHKKKPLLKGIVNDLRLIFEAIGLSRVLKVLKKEAAVKKFHPRKYLYLWYLGVLPQFQGAGIGSSLLRELICLSSALKLPVYLETSTEQNLPFYKRFNFSIYKELDVTYKLYLFKRDLTAPF